MQNNCSVGMESPLQVMKLFKLNRGDGSTTLEGKTTLKSR